MLQAPEKAVRKTAHEHKADQQKYIEKIVTAGNRLLSLCPEKLNADAVADRRNNTGHDQILQLRLSRKGPEAVIHAKQVQYRQSKYDIHRQKTVDGFHKMGRYRRKIKAVTHQQR